MTPSQCPVDMKAARQSFAQESAWQTILQCGIKLGISQRTFSPVILMSICLASGTYFIATIGLYKQLLISHSFYQKVH